MLNFLLVTFTILLAWLLKQILYKRKRLPPGPIRWPMLGSLPQMRAENPLYPHLQLHALAKKYGGIMTVGFGVHLAVVASDYDIVKDLFRRHEANIERFVFEYWEVLRQNNKNVGIIWSYGDHWKNQRKYALNRLRQFGFGKRHTMDETIQAEVNDLVTDIRKTAQSANSIWKVDIVRLSTCALNIVWASVGGYRFEPTSTKLRRELDINFEIMESLGPQNLLNTFPFLKVFPNFSGYRQHYEIHKQNREFTLVSEVGRSTIKLIEDAKKRRQSGTDAESFIEVYLDEIEINKHDPESHKTAEEELVTVLMDLFLGGSDTSSASIAWLLLHLGQNSDVQNKARKEIMSCTKAGPVPTPSTDFSRMPYIHAVMLEGWRHSAFIPIPIPRKAVESIECAGYIVPRGACLFANLYSIFHDKAFWGDPEVFRPERFFLPNGTLDITKTRRVIPFGVGNRSCLGEHMANISVFMILAGLLRHFSFEVVPGAEPANEPEKPSFTLKPKPFSLIVKPLNV